MTNINIIELLMAFAICIPSACIGFGVWLIQRKINKQAETDEKKRIARQKEVDERDEKRRQSEFLTWQTVNASLTLSEATARAVQRIPDAHCNGDMDSALNYAEQIKHNQRDFMVKSGIDDIYKQQVYSA